MPIQQMRAEELPRRCGDKKTMFEKMPEWAELKELVMEGIAEGAGVMVELSENSIAMTRQVDMGQVMNRFSARFRKLFPPAEFRYEMWCSGQRICVKGLSKHKKFEEQTKQKINGALRLAR